MIREIKDQNVRKIFQSIINTREVGHIQKCLDEGYGPIELINELKHNIGLKIQNTNMTIGQADDMIVFELLTIMASLLEQGKFDFNNSQD